MSFHWIDPKSYSFCALLLMDRYLIRQICAPGYDEEYCYNLAIALAANPAVAWYCQEKAPETIETIRSLLSAAPKNYTPEQVRQAECFILDRHDWAVVYVYPETMEQNCPYIRDWDKARLFELADFTGKLVLDVGAGTGRLTFAAAERARHVFASEPVDRLREYMREKIQQRKLENITVVDGLCHWLPYDSNTFDIVMSGHVIGDDYEKELTELERVTKPGGWILDCPGEDDRMKAADQEMLRRGFEPLYYKSKNGGDVYRYRKQVQK